MESSEDVTDCQELILEKVAKYKYVDLERIVRNCIRQFWDVLIQAKDTECRLRVHAERDTDSNAEVNEVVPHTC